MYILLIFWSLGAGSRIEQVEFKSLSACLQAKDVVDNGMVHGVGDVRLFCLAKE